MMATIVRLMSRKVRSGVGSAEQVLSAIQGAVGPTVACCTYRFAELCRKLVSKARTTGLTELGFRTDGCPAFGARTRKLRSALFTEDRS